MLICAALIKETTVHGFNKTQCPKLISFLMHVGMSIC